MDNENIFQVTAQNVYWPVIFLLRLVSQVLSPALWGASFFSDHGMTETSASLLDRVRRQSDSQAWPRLLAVYTPLIRGWLRRDVRLKEQDTDDAVQEVLSVVARRVSEFDRQRTGSFRAWLKSITVNCVRQMLRRNQPRAAGTGDTDVLEMLHQLEDPEGPLSLQWDREHDEIQGHAHRFRSRAQWSDHHRSRRRHASAVHRRTTTRRGRRSLVV